MLNYRNTIQTMQKLFNSTVLLVVFVLILIMVYNKDTVFKNHVDHAPNAQDVVSSVPCPTTCPEQFRLDKDARNASYVIPSDEELTKLNRTDLLTIFHRYTDYLDVLCRQQIRLGSVFAGGKHVCVDESIKPKLNHCLIYSFGSRNDFSFEAHAIRLYGCEVHTFDPLNHIMQQRGSFIIPILLFVVVLFLLIIYNRDVVGINLDIQSDQLFQKEQVKKKQVIKYVIPSDEEIDKSNNWTDLITIAHRYTDHIDVLCSQQIRVGSPFDGGKHVCIDDSIKPKYNQCLVYSFGSMNEFSFETDAIKLFGCEVHTFDPFASGSNAPKGCTYHRVGLGPKDEIRNNRKFQTLKSIMDDLNHRKRYIDILKIDIESSEWKFLENVLKGNILTHQVKQITIEMHFPSTKIIDPKLNYILRLLRRLNQSGFLTFSRERNTFCRGCTFYVPELKLKFTAVTEFSLLNNRFL